MKPKPKRLTAPQAADWLDMKLSTLLKRLRDGEIKAIKDGNGYLIEEGEVEAYDKRRQIAVIY